MCHVEAETGHTSTETDAYAYGDIQYGLTE